jgi:hypothetical protein
LDLRERFAARLRALRRGGGTMMSDPKPETPALAAGERMAMHEFLARFEKEFCEGCVPDFYQRPVEVLACENGRITVVIERRL